MAGIPLPAGTISLVVYVTDVFGAEARGSVDTDRVSPAIVNVSLPNVTADMVVNYTMTTVPWLTDGSTSSTQRTSTNAVTTLGVVSQVVVGSIFPCAYVSCGSIGRCVRGGCYCPVTSPVNNRTAYAPAPRNDSRACDSFDAGLLLHTVKPCAGSSADLTDAGVPKVECSGHGVCVRTRTLCLGRDVACTASCNCSEGWTGTSCIQSIDQVALMRLFQMTLISSTVQIWNTTYQTSSSASQQSSVLRSIVAMQDSWLPNTTTQSVLDFAATLSAYLAPDDSAATAALVDVVGTIVQNSNQRVVLPFLSGVVDAARLSLNQISTSLLDNTDVNVHPIVVKVCNRIPTMDVVWGTLAEK